VTLNESARNVKGFNKVTGTDYNTYTVKVLYGIVTPTAPSLNKRPAHDVRLCSLCYLTLIHVRWYFYKVGHERYKGKFPSLPLGAENGK
jgi:hypothetical protein